MKTIVINTNITVKSTPAYAGVYENPFIKTVEFVLTDDQPNLNKMGIAQDQFLSLAASAVFMPIKMRKWAVGKDHNGAEPIGVITETTIDQNRILGTGVVWIEERPEDVALLQDLVTEGKATLSWEIMYTTEVVDENGVMWLQEPKLLATTLVTNPAYEDRTKILAISSSAVASETLEEVIEEVSEELLPEEPKEEEKKEEETSPVQEDTEMIEELKRELEDLRRFKYVVERRSVIKETLGDIPETEVDALIDLTDSQLESVKRIIASRKREGNTPVIPVVPVTSNYQNQDPLTILKNYFGGSSNAD